MIIQVLFTWQVGVQRWKELSLQPSVFFQVKVVYKETRAKDESFDPLVEIRVEEEENSNEIVLVCSSVGTPAPHLTWMHTDTEISERVE